MKKIVVLLLALFMMGGLLCACGEPTEEGNEGVPGTDSAKELMSKVHYTYTRTKDGNAKEEEYIVNIKWTENGASVEGYQDSEEGRSEIAIELTLDEQKRPVSMTHTSKNPDGEQEQYSVALSYEKDRQIKRTVTYEEGNTRVNTYDFDENGRLIREESDSGYTQTYEYDDKGNCTLERGTWADSEDVSEYRTAYTYDDSGKIKLAVTTTSNSDTQTQIHYYYYPNGNVMMQMKISNRGDVNFGFYPNNLKDTLGWSYSSSSAVGMNMEYSVETDANGYITKVIRTNTTTGETAAATMEYDQNGNLVKYTNFYAEDKQWEYDSQNRLVKYTYSSGERVYEYDAQGRLVSEKKTTADGESETQTWAYNEAGMTVKRTESDVYTDGEGTMEQVMEIEYVENSNCPINNEWADFFLANLFDVT